MKPLVLALNAQFGVGAGGNRSGGLPQWCPHPSGCVSRAFHNGMRSPTLFAWRPVLVRNIAVYDLSFAHGHAL